MDQLSKVCPSSPLSAGMDKIQCRIPEDVYWMALTESTFVNQLAGIDRILSHEFRYHMCVSAMRQGTRLLRDDLEEPQLLAEMIRISNSRPVRILWSLNLSNEPMDLLFCGHGSTNTEDSTPAPSDLWFDPRDTSAKKESDTWTHPVLPVCQVVLAHRT